MTVRKYIVKKWDGGGMDWIDLAQDRDRWRAVVNGIMTFRAHKMGGGEFLDWLRTGLLRMKESAELL